MIHLAVRGLCPFRAFWWCDQRHYGWNVTYRRKRLIAGLAVAALATTGMPAGAQSSDVMPGFNGNVLTIAYAGYVAYLGGDFTAAIVRGRSVARGHLAAVDARTGALLPWAPDADGRVKALAVAAGSVYLAGDFGRVDGQRRDSLARVDAATGALSAAFKHTVSGRPYTAAVLGQRLYLGGAFTAVDGSARGRLAAFNVRTGRLDRRWRPRADDQVEAIATGGGRIYIGGRFRKVNSTAGYDRMAALDPDTAALVTGFRPRPPVITHALAVTADGVYSGHGGHGGTVAGYTSAGQLRWSSTFDGDAQAITVLGGTVYAGGHFDRACTTPHTGTMGSCVDGSDHRVKLAALAAADGRLTAWTADANGVEGVLALAGNPALGTIAMGGAFTAVDGRTQKRFAQFRLV